MACETDLPATPPPELVEGQEVELVQVGKHSGRRGVVASVSRSSIGVDIGSGEVISLPASAVGRLLRPAPTAPPPPSPPPEFTAGQKVEILMDGPHKGRRGKVTGSARGRVGIDIGGGLLVGIPAGRVRHRPPPSSSPPPPSSSPPPLPSPAQPPAFPTGARVELLAGQHAGRTGTVTGTARGRVGVDLGEGEIVGVPYGAARLLPEDAPGGGSPQLGTASDKPLSPIPPSAPPGSSAPRRPHRGEPPAPLPHGNYHPQNSQRPGPAQQLVIEKWKGRRASEREERARRQRSVARRLARLEERHRQRLEEHHGQLRAAEAERERARRQRAEERERQRERRLRQVRMPTPPEALGMRLHEVMLRRYQEQVEEPAERQREELLRQRHRQFHEASTRNGDWRAAIARHREAYEAEMKLRAAAHRQELRDQMAQWESKMPRYYRSALLELEQAERAEREQKEEELRGLPMKKRLRMEQYGALVGEVFSPPRLPRQPTPPDPALPDTQQVDQQQQQQQQQGVHSERPDPAALTPAERARKRRTRSQQFRLGKEYLRSPAPTPRPAPAPAAGLVLPPIWGRSSEQCPYNSPRPPQARPAQYQQGIDNMRSNEAPRARRRSKDDGSRRREPRNSSERQRRRERKAAVYRALRDESDYAGPSWSGNPALRGLAGGVVAGGAVEDALQRMQLGDRAMLQGIKARMELLEDVMGTPAEAHGDQLPPLPLKGAATAQAL